VNEASGTRPAPRSGAIRTIAIAAWAILVGGGATIVLLIGYVIGKLYLAGHAIEPPWYDTAGSVVVFGGGFVTALASFIAGWRALPGEAGAADGPEAPPRRDR